MITFDPPVLLDSGQKGDEVSIEATGDWDYGDWEIEGSAEEKGATLIDTWLKDTGDAP
jgi:hypothetical protein